jgi:hypothetical protein
MKVNLDDVEAKSFQLYENGPYKVRVKSIEEVTAGSGNPQLRVKTEFVDGQYEGKPLTDHITLIESVAWKVKKFLISVGLPSDGQIDTDSGAFRNLLNKSIGRTAIWVVGQRAGQDGQIRNTVLDYQEDEDRQDVEEDTPEFLQDGKAEEKWPEEK